MTICRKEGSTESRNKRSTRSSPFSTAELVKSQEAQGEGSTLESRKETQEGKKMGASPWGKDGGERVRPPPTAPFGIQGNVWGVGRRL